ncbi:MAG: carboxypeptidase-like regulatory domain-containing protein [Bacteroidales bacterium]|nr:carboxypeptidase-like regulatory domain-containing protein [Bacteroidales bacterium]
MPPFSGSIFRKTSAIILFAMLSHWQILICQETILNSVFTFREGTMKTGSALDLITKVTGYNFTYDSRLIDHDNRIRMTFTDVNLEVILDSILKNDSLSYSVIDKYIIISKPPSPPVLKADLSPINETGFISGIVIDEESSEPLPFATIGLKNKGRGTVANNNGEFMLKIAPDYLSDTLSVSYLGFIGREIPLKQSLGNNLTITMKREFISIPDIIIRIQIPQEIIFKALSAITQNYGNTPALMTAFYREGVMKKEELQTYSEAILRIYKSSYPGLINDQINVFKSRKIENLDKSDTLAIRLKAGLSTSLDLDGIKNNFDFMSRENLDNYIYRMSDIVVYDDETAYVIDFEQKKNVNQALFRGSMYINTDDFALLRADFEINPDHIDKMKNSFVTSPSRGFETWPASVGYSVSYRKINNRYFLNHVRGDLVFKAKKKKRLFNSEFTVFFELAVTDIKLNNVNRFEREQLAPAHSVFSKTITSYDAKFWENQDFLKPEDNLLQALKNMNVKMQEYSD